MPQEVISGQFFGLPYPTLVALQTSYTQALTDIATAGQSHAVSGRSFTLANIAEIRRTIAELQAAINRSNGTRIRRTFGYGGGYTR
jgi:hypothetical protein